MRLSFNDMFDRFIKTHGNKYKYLEESYLGTGKLMSIICPEHGEFKQRPSDHSRGYNCPLCSRKKTNAKLTDTVDEFLAKARNKFGSKYDYSLVHYHKSNIKIAIVCPIHGKFLKTPNKHLNGQGCPKCNNSHRRTQEDFIRDSVSVHGTLYDYSKAIYTNVDTNVTILCKIHGEFYQTPYSHIKKKCGCPSCANYGFKYTEPAILYYLQINNEFYKIGITNRTVNERFLASELKTIEVIYTKQFNTGYEAFKVEQDLLKENSNVLYVGPKILSSNGNTELFTENILERMKQYFIRSSIDF